MELSPCRAPFDALSFFDPFHLAADVLDRAVLDAQFHGGGAEESSSERFSQQFVERLLELRHFSFIARRCAACDH